MRRLLVLLLLLPAVPVFAQATDTPTPTPTPTATAIPDFAIYLTVVAPGTEVADAQAGSIVFTVNAGEVLMAIPIFGLLLIKLFNLVFRARGRDA